MEYKVAPRENHRQLSLKDTQPIEAAKLSSSGEMAGGVEDVCIEAK